MTKKIRENHDNLGLQIKVLSIFRLHQTKYSNDLFHF